MKTTEQKMQERIDELEEEIRQRDYAESLANVTAAKEHMDDVWHEHCAGDPTGQDGEREMDDAARDYIQAQDQHIKDTDPERWAEIRMGC